MASWYVLIGILMFVIFALFIMLMISFRERNRLEAANTRRKLIMDAHNRSEKRFLTLLLLEAKGINTGVKGTAALFNQFIKENKDLDEVEKFANEEVDKFKDGQDE